MSAAKVAVSVWEKRRWSLAEFAALLGRTDAWARDRLVHDDDTGEEFVDCGDQLWVPVHNDPTLAGRYVYKREYLAAEAARFGIPAAEVEQ